MPGRDYIVTRRCSEWRFFLRPDQDTNNASILNDWKGLHTAGAKRGILEVFERATTQQTGHNSPEGRRGDLVHGLLGEWVLDGNTFDRSAVLQVF